MSQNASVTIENGTLVIRLPIQQPEPSSTGKTLLVGQLGTGYMPAVKDPATGKPIRVQVTAMVKA